MKHRVEERDGAIIVAFEGDVDLEHSPKARTALLESIGRGSRVVVDMSAVSYIDSSGIASMVEAYQNARKEGKGFVLAAVSEPAMRVLGLARLDKVFTICATVEDGMK